MIEENTLTVANGRFDEQLSQMPPTQALKVKDQLTLTPGTDTTVFKIVESHDGSYTILYKTYANAKEANDSLVARETAAGTKIVPIAKAKLGTEYCAGSYTAETGCAGEKDVFTLGKLVEFQATGLIVVMVVIIGLCLLTYAMSFVLSKLGLTKTAAKAPAPVKTETPSKVELNSLDPNAESVHPGLTNAKFQALLGVACHAALEGTEDQIHPGLTNAQLAMLFAVAAAEVLGEQCNVVSFRPQNSDTWAWVAQGRANLHFNGLR